MYSVRLVHKISPSDKDVFGPVHLDARDLDNKVAMGAALRRLVPSALGPGQAVRSFRREAGGKIVAFPSKRSIWWSIVLTPVGGG
jgi:hypothetical protein